ncbi:hypothetical protein DAPPUDRAFT_313639 [Daphnia pulex]|uniref:Uncharacterized protein n=1 Tax=Daphnia pulex TaxID=6669 RepID=E9G3P8_DAPPU|nr:hypothetical protein DAPPUDRAFT_313639 [Daphnia pulex]|eukprot:EFX85804.1 hypothetical protein DAPPUDRAFT_313639 [Daphnia pulex]
MNFLNQMRNSLALCVFLFFLQLSIIHPVSGRNLVNIQRVTRNDQYYHQPENQALDVIPTTNEPFVPINDEIFTAVEQETADSSTGSPIIENDVNPFILVASDGQFADEPIPHPVEIVTPSFLDMDVGAIPEGSEPTVKQEDPSVNHQIVEEHFFNNLANSPTEVPENQAQLSFDAAPADPAVFVPEKSRVFTDVSAPVSDESEPTQKIEDLSVINPAVFEVPVSDESAAPIAENPFAEPVVVSVTISDEVEPAQKLEDPSVNPVVGDVRIFIPLVADVPNTDEATPIEEEPFADPAVAFAPVSDESEPVEKLEDPVTNPLVADVPFSDEAVAPIAENPSADPDVVSDPIPAEFEPAQKLEDPSVNPAVVNVPISDEAAAPIVENPVVDPVVISAAISDQVEPAHQPEVASVETELKTVVQSDPVDLPPSPVFISAVSPAAPTIIVAPQPVSPPVAEKVEINSLAAATLPKVKNALKSYSTQPKVTQQAVKQPADYSKTTRPSVSPTKPQIQYKYQPITSTSPSIAYGPPRITTNNPQSSYEKSSFPTRPFGSSPKPRQLGFPPVASTRDNVLLEVNWDAKLGRPYRQAKLH